MPVQRAKSCLNCRRAKSRCSLSAPCSRCAKRHLECQYATVQPRRPDYRWSEGFRPIRPADPQRILDFSLVEGTGLKYINPADVSGVEASTSFDIPPEETETTALTVPGATQIPLDISLISDFTTPQLFDLPDSFTFDDLLSSPRLWGSDLSTSSPVPQTLSLDNPSHIATPNPSNSLIPQLSQRTRSLHQGSLTAKMLFSRLTDYTRMMAHPKTLPLFIHPPCCLVSDGEECPSDSPHRCLPEALAVCANFMHMFYSRMAGSHGFVWQKICTHIRQLREEYESYDEERMLQALQAAMMYGMLCAQCTESVSKDDAAWVVDTIEIFAEAIYDMPTWGLEVDQSCLTRRKWVFVESVRRIGCLLYLFDLLLHIDTETPSRGDCPEFFDLPLPCVRELWQPVSNTEWKKRYQEHIDAKKMKGRRGLTLRHLLLLRQSSALGGDLSKPRGADYAEELAEWCERVDDLSMLLWMALTVEGEGQSHICEEGPP